MPYLVGTRGVLDAPGDSMTAEGSLAVGELCVGEGLLTLVDPVTFSVSLSHTGAGIVASGTVTGRVRTTCVRCLNDSESEVSATVDGFYVHPDRDTDLPEEQDREYVVDDRIDLEPALVSALALEVPYAPTCRPHCRGLCPRCGGDLNESACGCSPDDDGSPFSVLREAFPKPTTPD